MPADGSPVNQYLSALIISHLSFIFARTISAGELTEGETVTVDVKDGELTVEEK